MNLFLVPLYLVVVVVSLWLNNGACIDVYLLSDLVAMDAGLVAMGTQVVAMEMAVVLTG